MGMATGIDGYPKGWVAATLSPDGSISWATAPVPAIGALLGAVLPADGVVGVDMPIGLLERGLRPCDLELRSEMGRHHSRVFLTPPRAVLEAGLAVPNDEAQRLARQLTGAGVSRQALGLATRILALDAALAAAPGSRVVETYPELAFAAMAGRVLDPKTSARGVAQRWAALTAWLPDLADVVSAAPADVPVADALDALACLWSARRWAAGAARTIPADATQRPFVAV